MTDADIVRAADVIRHVIRSCDPPEGEGIRDLRPDALRALDALAAAAAREQALRDALKDKCEELDEARAALTKARDYCARPPGICFPVDIEQ